MLLRQGPAAKAHAAALGIAQRQLQALLGQAQLPVDGGGGLDAAAGQELDSRASGFEIPAERLVEGALLLLAPGP